MKGLALLVAAAACVDTVLAHYRWMYLLNPNPSLEYEFIRRNTNFRDPITDVYSRDIICNAGGLTGGSTQVASVRAGSTIGLSLDQTIYHLGPAQVYLSKAPGNVTQYDGSGDWFKIATLPPQCSSSGCKWESTQVAQWNFKIPAGTPSGQYLLRVEQIGLHEAARKGGAQFYISCGHLNISGGGNGSPGPLVKFPGAYKPEDPGLMIDIYWPVITSYPMPGPAVWSG